MNITLMDIVIRLVLILILSGVIGLEREFTKKPAGLRTHILVGVGATSIMLVSIKMFNQYYHYTSLDPARLGAQVISGIGFLGAGTIIREKFSVKGLTTAASIWVVGCIGIAVGSGYYEISIFSSLIVFLTLRIFALWEERNINKEFIINMKFNDQFDYNKLLNILYEKEVHIKVYNSTNEKIFMKLKTSKKIDIYDIIKEFSLDENIIYINCKNNTGG